MMVNVSSSGYSMRDFQTDLRISVVDYIFDALRVNIL